jgi:hypothetical protein
MGSTKWTGVNTTESFRVGVLLDPTHSTGNTPYRLDRVLYPSTQPGYFSVPSLKVDTK